MKKDEILEQEHEDMELEDQLLDELDREDPDDRIRADLKEFAQLFPQAAESPEDIPDVVWDAVRAGHTLTGAWAAWAIAQLTAKRPQAHQPFPSTGSMRSAGSAHPKRDAFLEGWGNN